MGGIEREREKRPRFIVRSRGRDLLLARNIRARWCGDRESQDVRSASLDPPSVDGSAHRVHGANEIPSIHHCVLSVRLSLKKLLDVSLLNELFCHQLLRSLSLSRPKVREAQVKKEGKRAKIKANVIEPVPPTRWSLLMSLFFSSSSLMPSAAAVGEAQRNLLSPTWPLQAGRSRRRST